MSVGVGVLVMLLSSEAEQLSLALLVDQFYFSHRHACIQQHRLLIYRKVAQGSWSTSDKQNDTEQAGQELEHTKLNGHATPPSATPPPPTPLACRHCPPHFQRLQPS